MGDVGQPEHSAYMLMQPTLASIKCNTNDFSPLDRIKYLLVKLSDGPYDEILRQTQKLLDEQIAGSKLLNFCVNGRPRHQIYGMRDKDFAGKRSIITHLGVEFEYKFTMMVNNKIHQQTGVFTWVGYELNTPNKHTKAWLDTNKMLDDFLFGALSERMRLQ